MCVAGGNTSILKMLQISTAFPRNHKHAFCLPAGLPLPPYPELLDSPHWSLGWGAALWGWGSVTCWGGGSPAAWAGCLAPPLSVWAAGMNVLQASASTLGTYRARQALPRSGVIMVPHPLLCCLGGPQPTLESHVVFGSSFCSVKYRGQC